MKSENYRCCVLTNSFIPCCFLYTGHLCMNPWRDLEHSTLFSSCECWNYSRHGGLPLFPIPWGIRNLLLSFDSIQMSEACSFLSPACTLPRGAGLCVQWPPWHLHRTLLFPRICHKPIVSFSKINLKSNHTCFACPLPPAQSRYLNLLHGRPITTNVLLQHSLCSASRVIFSKRNSLLPCLI